MFRDFLFVLMYLLAILYTDVILNSKCTIL